MIKMKIKTKSKEFSFDKRTYIMGILNVTPDSFSDGGSYNTIDRAVEQAIQMEKEGADILDIGGESTRPNHDPVSLEEELNRVIPVIQEVKKRVKIPISIDTYKEETARLAIEAGAEMINDIWGAKKEPEIAEVAASYDVPIILMHNRKDMKYENLIEDMKKDLTESIEIAIRAGVPEENIILDPGIGFAKTAEHNLIVMKHLEEFQSLGFPILLGASRKSFLRKIMDVPPTERDYLTGASTCLGIVKGVSIVRVHHVKLHKELSLAMDTMLKGEFLNG